MHNFRHRDWKPAQRLAGIAPLRRVYDLRHTFATFALRAGVSTFDVSRYMGASLTMIDRHYGHLARDGRAHAIALLDRHTAAKYSPVDVVDARWRPPPPTAARRSPSIPRGSGTFHASPLPDSNRRPLPYHGGS